MGTTAQKLQAIQSSKAAIKSAIEAKGVSDVGDVLADYATKIASIPSGGGGSTKYGMTIDSVFGDVNSSGQLQYPSTPFSLSSTEIKTLVDYALNYRFFNNAGLTSVNLPNLTACGAYVLQYACYGCTSLTSVDFSSLTSVGYYAMDNAFRGCTSLTSVDLSSLTKVESYGLQSGFQQCSSLTSVDLSSLPSVGNYGLRYAFQECTSLTNVYLTKVSSVGSRGLDNAFQGCIALELVDFSEATAVPALPNVNAFQNTNNTFKIVVPDALYNSWIAASNWSTYASHIVKASEYTPAS